MAMNESSCYTSYSDTIVTVAVIVVLQMLLVVMGVAAALPTPEAEADPQLLLYSGATIPHSLAYTYPQALTYSVKSAAPAATFPLTYAYTGEPTSNFLYAYYAFIQSICLSVFLASYLLVCCAFPLSNDDQNMYPSMNPSTALLFTTHCSPVHIKC